MKITKSQLKYIIQEELSQVLMERDYMHSVPKNVSPSDMAAARRNMQRDAADALGISFQKGSRAAKGLDWAKTQAQDLPFVKGSPELKKHIGNINWAKHMTKPPAEETTTTQQTITFDEPLDVKGDPDMTPEELAALDAGEQEWVYKHGVPADAKPGEFGIQGPGTDYK